MWQEVVILAAASLVVTVSGRPGLILDHQAPSNTHVIHDVAGMSEYRWESSFVGENVIRYTVAQNDYVPKGTSVPGANGQPKTDPGSIYDPHTVVSPYDRGVVPDNAVFGIPVQVPVENFGEEPLEVLFEASGEEPVVVIIEIPVEEQVELLIETPFDETVEGPWDGPISIYVEVPLGLPFEVYNEVPGLVLVEAPVEEPAEAPGEAGGEASAQADNDAQADEKATPAEEPAEGGEAVYLAGVSFDQPEANHFPLPTVMPEEATVASEIPSDGANETVTQEDDVPESDILPEGNAAAAGEESTASDGKNIIIFSGNDLSQVERPGGGITLQGISESEWHMEEGLQGEVEGVPVEGVSVHKMMSNEGASTLDTPSEAEAITRMPEDLLTQETPSRDGYDEDEPPTETSHPDIEGTTAKTTTDAKVTEQKQTPDKTTITGTPADTDKNHIDVETSPESHLDGTAQAGTRDLTFPQESLYETTSTVITGDRGTSDEAPSGVENLTEDLSLTNTRTGDLVDSMTQRKIVHMTNRLTPDSNIQEDIPSYSKTPAALQIPIHDHTTEVDDTPSVNTPSMIPSIIREGLEDVAGAVLPAGEALPEETLLDIEDMPEGGIPSLQPYDGESPVLRPPAHLHPSVLPYVSPPSYKYYPGIPVYKQKRKRPRGFLLPFHH